MTAPRIVTPEEAQWAAGQADPLARIAAADYAHTVATEPDRTRAAVVKALDVMAAKLHAAFNHASAWQVTAQARAIENGAPL